MSSSTPQAIVDNRADYYTFFTVASETRLLLSLPQWTKVTVELETAGPVAIGTRQQLDPVASGRGAMLSTDQPFEMLLGPNTRLYYAATGIHRVTIKVEAIPWMQSIYAAISALAPLLQALKPSTPAAAPPQRRC